MLREWLVRLRDAVLMSESRGGESASPGPSPARAEPRDAPLQATEPAKVTYRDPNKCLELVHTEATHISPEDALLPVLGSLVITMCWGYYLIITSPPLPAFVTNMLPSFLK